MTKKKVVKKRIPKKKVVINPDEKVYNINIMEYWRSGQEEPENLEDYTLIAEGRILHYEGAEEVAIALKDINGNVLINGDDYEWDDSRGMVVDKLQSNDDANTTSFKAFEQAGINLKDIIVIDSQSDMNEQYQKADKEFRTIDKNVPVGATLTILRKYNKATGKYTGAVWAKRVHRAGAILVTANDKTYIASMDDGQYYIIECNKSPKSLNAAFKALKPARVRKWEKDNKKEAKRQGEWYFIPAPKVKIIGNKNTFERTALPMKSNDSNAHLCDYIETIKKKHFVYGCIEHEDHDTVVLNSVHEAIENTAINSWSIAGVD
jgi:hypothetical protein